MNNQYLVIKLSGNWIEREQTKQKIKMLVEDIDVLVDTNIVTCQSIQTIPKVDLSLRPESEEYVKRKIADALGNFIVENGLVRYYQSEEQFNVKITGEITVISKVGVNEK